MAICTYEMMEFGPQYADDVIQNAKTLAEAFDRREFDVEVKEFGYTDSHWVALNMALFEGRERRGSSIPLRLSSCEV